VIQTLLRHPSIQSVTLRGLTSVGRFSLVYFLGSQLTLDQIGFFSIVQASIGYATGVCGFEYHAYMNRRIVGVPKEEQKWQLGNSLIAVLPSIIVAVLILTVFLTFLPSLQSSDSYLGFLPFFLIALFIFVAEYLGTELYRLFVSLGRPVRANVHLLIRNGTWPLALIALIPVMAFNDVWIIFAFWWAATTASLFVFFSYLKREDLMPSFRDIDWSWIRTGFKLSFALWVGSIFGRANVVLDRVILSASSLAEVGVYSLWMTCGLMLQVFFEAGLSSIALGRLLHARETARHQVLPIFYRFAKISVVLLCLVTAFLMLIFPVLPGLVGKPELIVYRLEFNLIILGNALIAASNISALFMFSQRIDRPFWTINISSTFVFVAMAIPLSMLYGVTGMATAFLLLSIYFLITRTLVVIHATRRFTQSQADNDALDLKSGVAEN
jgi:O-antigen/teichoic acid export membrane protein